MSESFMEVSEMRGVEFSYERNDCTVDRIETDTILK